MSFPPIEPYERGLLDVGDGNRLYWETSGSPDGKPALCVHGGPGAGGRRGSRKAFDPALHRIILFDQRGCGESTPNAADPAVSLAANTTHHLIADMERLREHLGVDTWLLYGGSWASTLILAYAQAYPERVSDIILIGVTMTRPEEVDWLYHGLRRFLPGPWEAFRDFLPAADRDGNVVAGYDRLLSDPAWTGRAAVAWAAWEDAVIAHETLGTPGAYSNRSDRDLVAFVRICAHYFANNAWLEPGQLLANAHRLAGIPGVLIHGRLDLGSPLLTAWELARAWPDAELQVIADSGHTGSPAMAAAIDAAVARFAPTARAQGASSSTGSPTATRPGRTVDP
jgi:proline iminopeptidase